MTLSPSSTAIAMDFAATNLGSSGDVSRAAYVATRVLRRKITFLYGILNVRCSPGLLEANGVWWFRQIDHALFAQLKQRP